MNTTGDPGRQQLAPTGTLRIAIAFAPAPSPFFATQDSDSGTPRGVTIDLGTALARRLNLPATFVTYPNSGEISARADAGEWDVTFMPADAERAKQVDFGPPYALVKSTFLAASGSGLNSLADVDRAGVRVAAIADTATARSAARFLKQAHLVHVQSVDAAFDALRSGQAEAMALSRGALVRLAAGLPGSRVLDGHFHAAGVAVAVPRNRPAALALVTEFIEDAKQSGEVRRALEAAGLDPALAAPPRAARR